MAINNGELRNIRIIIGIGEMASTNSLISLLSCWFLLFVLAFARKELALEASEEALHYFHTVQLSSFLPSSICNPSTLGLFFLLSTLSLTPRVKQEFILK